MSSINAVILLAFAAQANAEAHDQDQISMDNLVDKLIENYYFFDRAFKASPIHQMSLDSTVLGKPGQLSVSRPTIARSVLPGVLGPQLTGKALPRFNVPYQTAIPGRVGGTLHRVCAEFDKDMFKEYEPAKEYKGTKFKLVEYPNPVLRAPNAKVTEFDSKLANLTQEMFKVMYNTNGMAVAAPQVGLNQQLFVYNIVTDDPNTDDNQKIVVNPTITRYGPKTEVKGEGSLSTRTNCCYGDINRAVTIDVEFQDLKGVRKSKTLKNQEACVFQHAYDHLQGVLHIDRLSPKNREQVQPYLDALVKNHGPGGAVDLSPEIAAKLQPPAKVEAAPKAVGFGGASASAKKGGKAKKGKR